ncbi:MAG: hypothetical protein ACFE9T_12095 [Promethearchaeota archaeon]
MEKYSLKRNLKYMAEAFCRPKALLNNLLNEELLLYYAILPLILFTIGYETLYIIDYLMQKPFALPFINLLRLITASENQYYFCQMVLFPIVHLIDFIIFWVVIHYFSKMFKDYSINSYKMTYFSIFIWDTIGLISLFGDILLHIYPSWGCLMFTHPLCGLIGVIYGVFFLNKQSGISKSKALILYTTSWISFITFRMLFLG